MSVCNNIKEVKQRHAWIGDFFSLLAIVLLFGSIWAAIEYGSIILSWIGQNPFFYAPLTILGIILDISLIFGLLCAGSESCEDDNCFRTFRGRRHGVASLGGAFSSWLKHMEQVGRKHR